MVDHSSHSRSKVTPLNSECFRKLLNETIIFIVNGHMMDELVVKSLRTQMLLTNEELRLCLSEVWSLICHGGITIPSRLGENTTSSTRLEAVTEPA